ncbi:DUF5677 domain-containing protein [Rhizobium paknamense]|uniref:AbiV family abortive infection protein n=1 Tax=Rhizobium paknamense TaxID=1206817 RepID=A0ABU0IAI2_9HYPH|nr:DUF5677 domain-containing protein [Rhizobium paknamense]MDQ0455238.1 hypothetical protein [Rhizobium paknamense]
MTEESPLRLLQEASLQAHAVIRDEIAGLFARYGTLTPDVTQTLKRLFVYLSDRNQAVSFLVSWGYSWDAEIIMRSLYETSAKILFICLADDKEKPELLKEFWDKLGSIGNKRRARKAEFCAEILETDTVPTAIFQALNDERVFDFGSTGNKAERKRLEQKWSFSEIIASLDGRVVDSKPLVGIKSMLHLYGMCSHLAHADSTALDLMTDRALRSKDELLHLEAGHISRILSDQVSLTWLCAEALRHHFKGEFDDKNRFYEAFQSTEKLAEPIQAAFNDSQRAFYEGLYPKN